MDVSAWLRLPDGRDLGVPLVASGPRALVGRLDAPLPSPARLFALTLTESALRRHPAPAPRRRGRARPARPDRPARPRPGRGSTRRGSPAAGTGSWTGWSSDGATVTRGPGRPRHRVRADRRGGGRAGRRRAGPAAGATPTRPPRPRPTAACCRCGSPSGPPVPARVVGVLPRFPTVGPSFVVADARALADALDARDPGTGSVRELWLSSPDAPTRWPRP